MSKKIKILYIVEAMGGGVYTYIVSLTKKLADYFEVYVAYGIRKQTPQNFKNDFDKRIHLIEVKNFTRSIDPAKDINAYKEIKQIQSKIMPDIIHLNSSKAGVLGRMAFRKLKIPIFYTPHGYSFLMADQSRVKRIIYKFVEKVSAVRNCQTISCSPGEHEETLKLTKNATYVNNGIDIDILSKLIENLSVDKSNKESYVVCTVGRISYQKNPKQFNEIAKKLPNVKFIWIGDGDLKTELDAGNIDITGWLNHSEVLKKVSQSDIFILTSLWEGLPMALLEAMYLQKICIVSDVIGNHDVIQNEKNGYVCETTNEFVATISSILFEKNSLIETVKENAKKDITQTYNIDTMAEKYKSIYESKFEI